MHHSESVTVSTPTQFEVDYLKKVQLLLASEPVNRGPAHATTDESMASTHELMYVTETFNVSAAVAAWQEMVRPNLPWAEDHFNERISGEPLNPAPSEAWWPFARQGNAEHKKDKIFSHTYPERFWPRVAGKEREYENLMSDQSPDPMLQIDVTEPHRGIRYDYGDLNDLLGVLNKNINSRQAYLPIWFPEDLTAAHLGDRVPCSMGYHFIMNKGFMDCVYTMRSCDIVRFYRDDIYMAGRLLQYVAFRTNQRIGKLVIHIDNLHCFPGDRPFLEALVPKNRNVEDRRAGYDFGALG